MSGPNLLSAIPNISIEQKDGKTLVSLPGAFGLPVTCSYWKVENVGHGGDPWRFQYGAYTEKSKGIGPYSHPSEAGCQIAIRRWFLDNGFIPIPEDNTHLDERDRVIAAQTEHARAQIIGKPRVGDFVIKPDGSMHRCAHAWEYGMQTTTGGSFHVSTDGHSSMSGSLDPAHLWETFEDTKETRLGRFWFFRHNLAGAGRGVDVFLSCRVYRLVPKTMTQEEAEAHPKALDVARRWEKSSEVYIRTIRELMRGMGS